MRLLAIGISLLAALTSTVLAQEPASSPNTTAVSCTFQDGTQMSVRYQREDFKKGNLQRGSVFTPGGAPMLLFTETEVSLGNSTIPPGAYSMYVIPEKKTWTIIVSRNVTPGAQYDQQQDLVRVSAETGHLSQEVKRFQVAFGHVAPKECNMRLNYGGTGSWVEFKQK